MLDFKTAGCNTAFISFPVSCLSVKNGDVIELEQPSLRFKAQGMVSDLQQEMDDNDNLNIIFSISSSESHKIKIRIVLQGEQGDDEIGSIIYTVDGVNGNFLLKDVFERNNQ